LDVLEHPGDLHVVRRNIAYDVVLAHPNPGHAGQVGQLFAVRAPDLRYVVQMLVRFPEISVVYRLIRPSSLDAIGAY